MKPKFFGAIILLFLNICAVSAQNKNTDAHLTGHVLDAITKEHLPYATVLISGTNIGAASDATGHFLIKNLRVGEYKVVASFLGYQPSEQVVRIEKDKTIEIKFELTPTALEIGSVVVTGSRNETNKKESATIVNVMSSRLIEATASTCPADVLNFQSGLRVEQTCSNCGVPQLRINGLEGQYSQILLDSRPIFSSLASVYGLEQLPAGMIERIEVIRGGGSALFGSNAIGGVVNIITKEPMRNTFTLSNNSAISAKGTKDINTTLNGAFVTDNCKAGVYIFGMVRDRDAYDRNQDGFSDFPELASETIGFRGYYKMSPLSKLTAEYHHIREFRRGGDNLDSPPHEAYIAEQLRHGINGGGLKYDYLSSDYKHKFSLHASVQNIDRDSYFGTDKNPDAYGKTTDFTFVGGGQYAYSFDKLLFMPSQFTIGLEYSNNSLNDQMLGYNRVVDQQSICYGTYIQNEWKSEKLGILIGGRLDKHNLVEKAIFSPRMNIRYTPIETIGLRASYSSGYRAPQAYDEDLHVAAVGGDVAIITLSPDLSPEYSHSLSASADLYHNFGSVETNLLIEGFYTNIKDVFSLEPNGTDAGGNMIFERRNGSGATVKGLNFEAKLGFTPKFIVNAGYTLQQSRYKEAIAWSENSGVATQKSMLRSPDQYGYVTLNYLPTKKFTASISGNYSGSMLVPHYGGDNNEFDWLKNTQCFYDMGIRLAYDFQLSTQTKLQISGGVKNIFDQFQNDIDRGKTKDAGYIYGPAAPRMFHLGVKFTM